MLKKVIVIALAAIVSAWYYRPRVFTKEELALYDGIQKPQVYLSLMGEVFDVTAGAELFYGANKSYSFFAATDGSLAFITGDFINNITDDVSSLDHEGLYNLKQWVNSTYHAKYLYKGTLNGYFYLNGRKTDRMKHIESKIQEETKNMSLREADKAKYKGCFMKKARGTFLLYCKDETKVVRKRQVFGGKERCVCVDLEDADPIGFLEYDGCPPTNFSCDRWGY